MAQESGDAYLPAYDNLGNVHGMLWAFNGELKAALGGTIRESGTYASLNPFRFSTKYTDDETGLVYYGRRYYDPQVGRFVGRDPIGEEGGLNLYAFVANNSVNSWDYLGMEDLVDSFSRWRHSADNSLDNVTPTPVYYAPDTLGMLAGIGVTDYSGGPTCRGYGRNRQDCSFRLCASRCN
jgi:RHS repeat-associated protein